MTRRQRQSISGQRGAGLLLGLILVFTFILMLAWIVDVAQLEQYIGNVQSATDAAALAGADQFDLRTPAQLAFSPASILEAEAAKKEAWRNAKEAVFLSLNNSPLTHRFGKIFNPEAGHCIDPFTGVTPPDTDIPSTDDDWTCREWEFSNLMRVRVERGLWYIDHNDKQVFLSLENSFTSPAVNICDSLQSATGLNPNVYFPDRCGSPRKPAPGEPTPAGSTPYWVPNAVKVRIVLNRLPTYFGRLSAIGMSDFKNLSTRETVASREPLTKLVLTSVPPPTDPW